MPPAGIFLNQRSRSVQPPETRVRSRGLLRLRPSASPPVPPYNLVETELKLRYFFGSKISRGLGQSPSLSAPLGVDTVFAKNPSTSFYAPRGRNKSRLMICRWISLVPSQIRSTRASLQNRSIGKSSINPMPP